jgi:preprotein translocase subunit SecY
MTAELARRIAVTIGALLVYRLGCYIPLPGVDPVAWDAMIHAQGSVGAIAAVAVRQRLVIFALDILPYITAAVIVQMATIVSRRVRTTSRDGERGRRCMVRATLGVMVVLTVLQAWGIASALGQARSVVTNPGPLFIISATLTLTGGAVFLAWLAEQITTRGIGNGIALILLTGIVTELPREIATALEFMRQYRVSNEQLVAVALIVVAVNAVVVMVELARRRLPVRYAARAIGTRIFDERESYLSLKLNPAGIVPVLLASFVMSIFVSVLAVFGSPLLAQLSPAGSMRQVLYALLIILCTFFYTASVLDPEESAEKLKTLDGKLETIEPGEPTAAYLDRTLSRTTLIGAVYLALVCLLPDILIRILQVPVYFGGTALLIAVCALIDLRVQFQAEVRSRARP